MNRHRFFRDDKGATALEFALTAPLFFALVLGIGAVGLGLFAQMSLQHAVERAARCAGINTTLCGTAPNIITYAATQAYGLKPPTSIFTVTTPGCGTQVAASYPIHLNMASFGKRTITLTASSCYPK